MKLVYVIGGALSLAFAVLALHELYSVALAQMAVALCIWAFGSALGLSLGIYVVSLSHRIAALEKRPSDRQ